MCDNFQCKLVAAVPDPVKDEKCSKCSQCDFCIHYSGSCSDAAYDYFKRVVDYGEKFQVSSV